ncbi:putative ABC transporter ATP-binding protein [Clostridium ljungdahlii DSM 13528]|uniref:ABC transporter ATP-binding protein n=1 Tax=Clostridium ljungdahlii (strain ATCC 55383 / DSM 13528 / PETC) TaxID=748727 RepID=D8GKH0_CLOLD|nr:ABC transporter ATP-binding protein [Clostridium ljungdahlii]ADK15310.1 predicted ABC transporter, ATPase and permease component [Clostridium ljungdahlii DSM 13528]OAA88407.1 putative ABC transporter ATP-binding protein [Clostridium ljungdahlii DSM 13528]
MGNFSSLLKLIPFLKKYRIIFTIGIIGMIFSSIISTPIPYIIGRIMDKILITKQGYSDFYKLIAVIALLYILRYILAVISKYMFVKVSNSIVNEMRYLVMDKVIDLPMDYISSTQKGYIQARISECSSVGGIFSPQFISIFLNLIDTVMALGTMFVINYKLSIIILFLTPVFFITSKKSASGFMKNTQKMMESSAILNGDTFEIINGIEDIKVLNGKNSSLLKFKNKLDELTKDSTKQSKAILLFTENITLINDFGTLLILLIAGIMILKGQFTIGLYTSFSLYIAKVFSSTQALATIGTIIKPVCLSIERIYQLLDMQGENSGKHEYLNRKIESIELNNVDFKYNTSEEYVLKNLSFKISKGKKILIKGENGSGKSTLIKLLIGLYTPTSGKIFYNRLDLERINNKSLRNRIGIVSQNIFLFRGTVLENILYGQTNRNREHVEKLIDQFMLTEYIHRLPRGLDTEISQNTAGVSGGQAQVIAFIRAMLSNKDVIILDEPISNVDAETREIMLRILKSRKTSSILIIISHITKGIDFIDKIIEI